MNLRNRTIYIGDNLNRLRGIDSESIDLIYLDPPFNSQGEYQWPIGKDDEEWADDDDRSDETDDLDDDQLERLIEGNGLEKFKDAFTLDDLDQHTLQELLDNGEPAGYVIAAAGAAVGPGTQAYLTYMWERLVEMRRILKSTGSIYLHCDDTEGAWLKALMDAIFGRANFRNEIIWQRTRGRSTTRRFGRIADTLLFYVRSSGAYFNPDVASATPDLENLEGKFQQSDHDERGLYRDSDLTGAGTREAESGEAWRGYQPGTIGRHWSVPRARGRDEYGDWIVANVIPAYDLIDSVKDRLDALERHGMIHWTSNNVPRLKRYLVAGKEQVHGSVWVDIPPINSQADEDTGWDTQKPLALLERLIAASSREGDMVLDPFCGCATACVAAERLNRQWVGMDRSPRAGILVRKRLREQKEGIAIWVRDVIVTRIVPKRADITEPPITRAQLKAALFGKQLVTDGSYPIPHAMCAGPNCGTALPIHLLEIDRIRPGTSGGDYSLSNTQLLCPWCNRVKGNREIDYLASRIAQRRQAELES